MINKPVSLVPKILFDGEDNMYDRIGPWVVPVICSISRRLQYHRRVSTISLGLIIDDLNRSVDNNRRLKYRIEDILEQLQYYDYIVCAFDKAKVRDAIEVQILYENEPFILLYEHEFEAIREYGTVSSVYRLLGVYLYIVKHINERTKRPTWVSASKVAEDLHLNLGTVCKYIAILRDELNLLTRISTSVSQHGGVIAHHTRNMAEYLLFKNTDF